MTRTDRDDQIPSFLPIPTWALLVTLATLLGAAALLSLL